MSNPAKVSIQMNYTSNKGVGISLYRDGTVVRDSKNVTVVLKKDIKSVLGYRIETAFVDP